MEDTGNMVEFAGIGEVAETTTHLLALSLQAAGRRRAAADPVQHLVLQQARDYLNEVRDGFVLSVRSHQVGSLSEIGYLLDRVLIDWDAFSRELGKTGVGV